MPQVRQWPLLGVFLAAGLAGLFVQAELLKELKAECTREGIKVQLMFKKPFYGVAYSLGHFDSRPCQYIHQNTGSSIYSFLIPAKECGTLQGESSFKSRSPVKTSSVSESGVAVVQASYSRRKRRTGMENVDNRAKDIFMENTLLIQQDPSIQESTDIAQKLRCVWQNEIHKPLTASFLPVQHASASRTRPHGYASPAETGSTNIGRYSMPEQKEGFYGVVNPINMQSRPKGQVQSVHVQQNKSWTKPFRRNQTRFRQNPRYEKLLPQLPTPLPLTSASCTLSMSATFLILGVLITLA